MISDQEISQTVIRREISDGIGELILDNAEKFNALPQHGWEAVPQAVASLIKDGARVIVVSGAGSNFCAGADISEFDVVRKNAETAEIYEKSNSAAFASLRNAPVPTLAKIRGYCLGGGFGLAAACDLRFADHTAEFGVPAARLGLAYPVDAMADIVEAVGVQNAKEILFTARRYSADQMAKFGYLSHLTEDDLEATVKDTAREIADLAPLTHRASKATIAALTHGDTRKAEELGHATFTSEDYVEGRAAFREKRKPLFAGK